MESTLRIQDYILKDIQEPEEKAPARAAAKPVYEARFASGPDFIVSRKSSRTEDELVFLTSQNQFYIKRTFGKKEEIKPLTEKLVMTFVKDLEEDIPLDGSFFASFPEDRDRAKALFHLVADHEVENARNAIAAGYLRITNTILDKAARWYTAMVKQNSYWFDRRTWTRRMKMLEDTSSIQYLFDTYKNLGFERESFIESYSADFFNLETDTSLADIVGDKAYSYFFYNPNNIHVLVEAFGKGGVHDFIKMVDGCSRGERYKDYPDGVNLNRVFNLEAKSKMSRRHYHSREDEVVQTVDVTYNPKDFFEYLTYQPTVQGYPDPREFVLRWIDTLEMELCLFGEIRDKYPKHLESLHQKLSVEVEKKMEAEENEKANSLIKERVPRLPSLSIKDAEITPAASKEEILNVARMHRNCLASYVDRYSSGATDLYFMREDGIVTVAIEIKNGTLRQAFRARNERPTKEQFEIIEQFCNENGFAFNTQYAPC